MNLDRVRNYHLYDPQYNPIYNDSREFVKNIQPITLQEKINSDDYKLFLKNHYPKISRCWGERYENCQVLRGDKNLCSKQYITTRDPAPYLERDIKDEIKASNDNDNVSNMNLKKINSNTLYDVSRIPIDNKLNMIVDKTPDILNHPSIRKTCESKISKNDYDDIFVNRNLFRDPDIVEGFSNSNMNFILFVVFVIFLWIIFTNLTKFTKFME